MPSTATRVVLCFHGTPQGHHGSLIGEPMESTARTVIVLGRAICAHPVPPVALQPTADPAAQTETYQERYCEPIQRSWNAGDLREGPLGSLRAGFDNTCSGFAEIDRLPRTRFQCPTSSFTALTMVMFQTNMRGRSGGDSRRSRSLSRGIHLRLERRENACLQADCFLKEHLAS